MNWILPALILAFLLFGMLRRSDVYDAFTEGAKDAFPLLLRILPFIAAMMIAISAFRACGAFDAITNWLGPAFEAVGMPKALGPLILLRPFSGSGAMALLKDIYDSCGVDSFEGFTASILLGSTETVFYAMALYFGSIGVKKLRYALTPAMLGMLAGIGAALALAYLYY